MLMGAPNALEVPGRARMAPRPARAQGAKRLAVEAAYSVALLAIFALPLPWLLQFGQAHAVIAVVLSLAICGISFYSHGGAIVAATVYLAFLGDYRRYVGFLAGYPESDPLLLVAPVVACFLFCRALMDRRQGRPSGLAVMVAVFMFLMFAQMLNPVQGGVVVGMAGSLFYLVPLLWFWIGRAYGEAEFLKFFSDRVVLVIGIFAALWGCYQTFFGLFTFEQLWVQRIGYGALYISDDVIRAIGFFTSSAEYQRYLLITAAILLATWLATRSRRVLILLPMVLTALFLSAARGPVVMFVGAATVVWAIAARSVARWLARFVVAVTAGAVFLVGFLMLMQERSFGERVDLLVTRQTEGLLDPTNPQKSTAVGHLYMIAGGVAAGFATPLGHGLGATTLAASKYGARATNAEFDFANVMWALGLLGGMIYAAIIVTVLLKAIQWWRVGRQPVGLVIVGILFMTLGGWLIGGEYSTAALVWFFIGALDRLSRERRWSAAEVM